MPNRSGVFIARLDSEAANLVKMGSSGSRKALPVRLDQEAKRRKSEEKGRFRIRGGAGGASGVLWCVFSFRALFHRSALPAPGAKGPDTAAETPYQSILCSSRCGLSARSSGPGRKGGRHSFKPS